VNRGGMNSSTMSKEMNASKKVGNHWFGGPRGHDFARGLAFV